MMVCYTSDALGNIYEFQVCNVIICVRTHQNDAFVGVYHFEQQACEVDKHEKVWKNQIYYFFFNKWHLHICIFLKWHAFFSHTHKINEVLMYANPHFCSLSHI